MPTHRPAVLAVSPAIFPTVGGTVVTITGDYFRDISISTSTIVVTYGQLGTEYTATGCTLISSSTSVDVLTCATVAGVGQSLSWIVTIGDSASAASCTSSGICTRYVSLSVSFIVGDVEPKLKLISFEQLHCAEYHGSTIIRATDKFVHIG
jgi:hypothetical protein